MSILKVARLGHPILRQKSRPVEPERIGSPEIQRLIDNMYETMAEYGGVGLAAPQVHEPLQLFITAEIPDPDDPDEIVAPPRVMINTELAYQTEEEIAFWEGCLSIPDFRGLVPRIRRIGARGYDREGRRFDFEEEDFPAVVIQHELDHTHGTVFLDRMRDMSSLSYISEFDKYHAGEPVAD